MATDRSRNVRGSKALQRERRSKRLKAGRYVMLNLTIFLNLSLTDVLPTAVNSAGATMMKLLVKNQVSGMMGGGGSSTGGLGQVSLYYSDESTECPLSPSLPRLWVLPLSSSKLELGVNAIHVFCSPFPMFFHHYHHHQ
jgi:hypothetical protein